MSDIKSKYGTGGQVITITLAPGGVGLASGSARESLLVDNTTNLFLDALVGVKVKFANTAPTGDKRLYIYAAGVWRTASLVWPDAVTGADAAITLNSPTQLKLIGAIEAAQNVTRVSEPLSVAQAFGGILPPSWSIVLLNSSGAALTTTESDHFVEYIGILAQSP